MNELPYLVDDFFGLLNRGCKFLPEMVLKSPYLEHFLKLSETGINLDIYKPSCQIFIFIINVVKMEIKYRNDPSTKVKSFYAY